MEVTVFQALAIAIWIALVMSRSLLGGATTTLRFTPMMTGLIVGIVFGDIANAMMITAAIQLIYMGVFSPGGQMPSEPAIAAGIAVPVALLGGLAPEAAISVAVPVGLLGSYLYQFRFFINTFIMQKFADKYAKEANSKMVTVSVIWLPILVSFVIFIPFMFIALYYGAPVIASVVESSSSSTVFHVLQVIGSGLASIGIAVTVSSQSRYRGRRQATQLAHCSRLLLSHFTSYSSDFILRSSASSLVVLRLVRWSA